MAMYSRPGRVGESLAPLINFSHPPQDAEALTSPEGRISSIMTHMMCTARSVVCSYRVLPPKMPVCSVCHNTATPMSMPNGDLDRPHSIALHRQKCWVGCICGGRHTSRCLPRQPTACI